jgi:hypothetical protein
VNNEYRQSIEDMADSLPRQTHPNICRECSDVFAAEANLPCPQCFGGTHYSRSSTFYSRFVIVITQLSVAKMANSSHHIAKFLYQKFQPSFHAVLYFGFGMQLSGVEGRLEFLIQKFGDMVA